MQLNPQAFNRHLEHMGQRVSWRRAFACPCRNPHSNASDPKCPHCSGKGYLWDPAQDSVVGIASSKVQREWAQFGMYESGDAVISIPESSALYDMGQNDRVLMLNATEQFSITLVRGAPTERLAGRVESISRVFWFDAQKNVVTGGTPGVEDSGRLTWTTGEPPANTQYGISGVRFVEYYCHGPYPSSRSEHKGARLPKRVVLRKFDLWGRANP